MQSTVQSDDKNQNLVVLKKPSPKKPAPWRELFLNLKPEGGPRAARLAIAAIAQACAKPKDGSLEQKLNRLSGDELDRAILAVMFLEGLNLSFREGLRKSKNNSLEPGSYLPATTLVSWLSGGDVRLSEEIAKRIHPQSPLATDGFIERENAQVPLEGTIRLSSALAGLMISEGTNSRLLEWGMRLEWPQENLDQVVLNDLLRAKAVETIDYARQEGHLTMLLCGEPGTGKTLMARALAKSLGRPILTLESSGIPRDCDVLMRAFLAARVEGAVLFLDEFDRWVGNGEADDFPPPTSGLLLTHMETFRGFLVGASNRYPPKPFRRRFKFTLYFGTPGKEESEKLWANHLGKGADPEVCEKLAAEFEMSGGLISNAVSTARAASQGSMPDLKTLRDAAAAQFPNLFGWCEDWGSHEEGKAAWDWISDECRTEVLELAARFRVAHNWFKPRIELNRLDGYPFHKALLLGKNEEILIAVSRQLAQNSGLRPLFKSLSALQRELRNKPELNLESILNQMSRGGFLPILYVPDVRKEPEVLEILGLFEKFGGLGLVACLEKCFKDLEFKPRETLRLKELDSEAAVHRTRNLLKETDGYRFEGIDPEDVNRLCGKEYPRAVLTLAVLEAQAKTKTGEKPVVNRGHVEWALKTRAGNNKGLNGYLFDERSR